MKKYTHVNGLTLLEETLRFLALINTGSDIYSTFKGINQ